MNLLIATSAELIALNVKFFFIRLTGILIRVMPFKAFFMNILGTGIGLFFMLIKISQWRAIKRFARHTKSPLSSLMYIMNYFIQQGKDGVWGYVFCEAPSVLDPYIITHNAEAINHAHARGKGVIFLGAHYGPALYSYMLYRMHFDVKTLLANEFVTYLHHVDTLVLKPFRSKKVMFLNDLGIVLVSHEQERHFVGHLKKGGMVLTHIDLPAPEGKGETIPFFDLAICPRVFPFRLALKYDIPVFFCLFNNIKRGGYLLDFIRSGEYSTPAEGFQKYIACLEAHIKEYPFMWSEIPHFLDWSSCRRIDPSDYIEPTGREEDRA